MKKLVGLLSVLFIFLSACGDYKYPKNKNISESNGSLIGDSITTETYILDSIPFAGKMVVHNWPQTTKQKINTLLRTGSSPILYNYYLNRDIFRLTIIDSDTCSMLVDISKQKDRYWLSSKKIIGQFSNSEDSITLFTRTQDLNQQQWNDLNRLINTSNFFEIDKLGDSSQPFYYFVEFHSKDRYWYVLGSKEDQDIQKIVDWVLSINKMKF